MPLTEVAPGTGLGGNEEAAVDIVAVHGLNPLNDPDHAYNTWRKPSNAEGVLWLRDLIPAQIPLARIFIYGYDSNPAFSSTNERFVYQANDLLNRIAIKRKSCPSRPLIFVAHSLGGILVKQALVNAHNNPEPKYNQIKLSTCGLVFFGTPHDGGGNFAVGLGKISAHVVRRLAHGQPPRDLMEVLERGSTYSVLLKESWRHQLKLFTIKSFYELRSNIVPRESATIGLPGDVEEILGLDTDHSGLCKFDLSNEDDKGVYEVVSNGVTEVYEAAISRVDDIQARLPNIPDSLPGTASRPQMPGLGIFMNHDRNQALTIIEKSYHDIAEGLRKSYSDSFRHYDYEQSLRLQSSALTNGSWAWLDRTDQYRQWAGSRKVVNPQFSWIAGQVGSGKSPLLAHIIEALEDGESTSSMPKSLVLYSQYEKRKNRTGSQMLCILIHQVLQQLPDIQENAYHNDINTFGSNIRASHRPLVHLWTIFRYALKLALKSVTRIFIILDGLYQCDKETQQIYVDQLHMCRGDIRIIASWRTLADHPTCPQRAGGHKSFGDFTLSLDNDCVAVDGISKDLDKLVDDQLKTPTFSRFDDNAKGIIYKTLRGHYGHTFLTTCLALSWISRTEFQGLDDLQTRITRFPVRIDGIYKCLLEDLRSLNDDRIPKILKYLVFAFESFKLEELEYAIQQQQGDFFEKELTLAQLLDKCRPLMIVAKQTHRIKFWHHSAQEFLASYLTSLPPEDILSLRSAECHQDLATACLSRMMFAATLQFPVAERLYYGQSLNGFFRGHPLLLYAFHCWYQHLRYVAQSVQSPEELSPGLISTVTQFSDLWKDNSQARFRHMAVILGDLGLSTRIRTTLSRFELFCALGLTVFVQYILDQRAKASEPRKFQDRIEKALALSIERGHADTAKMLINRYGVTSMDGPAYEGLIEATALANQIELLKILLRMRRRYPTEITKAHQAAFSTGNIKIVEALSANRAFQDRDEWGNTVLHAEFAKNVRGIPDHGQLASIARIRLLVQRERIDILAKETSHGNTALHLACFNGYDGGVITELLKLGADPMAKNTFHWTSLHLAARYGDPEATRQLIEVGGHALVGTVTRGGNSALHWATQTLSPSVTFHDLQYLMRGSNISTVQRRAMSLRMLLEAGADPLLRNAKGESAASHALANSTNQAVLQIAYTRLERPLDLPWELPDSASEVETIRAFSRREFFHSPILDSDSEILAEMAGHRGSRREQPGRPDETSQLGGPSSRSGHGPTPKDATEVGGDTSNASRDETPERPNEDWKPQRGFSATRSFKSIKKRLFSRRVDRYT